MKTVYFKKGIYKLNKQPNFDFQLNRVIMWDGGRLEDIEPIAKEITDSHTWKRELIQLGDSAMSENRIENAIAYYRMSEFFMYDGDSDKLKYYRLATKLFYEYYDDYFNSGIVEKLQVPYEDVFLPILHTKPKGEPKDTLLLHGGNDSYYEELFFPMLYFAQNGFEVYLFEGPGQGSVIREQGKPFTYQWEKPVKIILDFLHLMDVTIIGASLGGMLAPRAAAFEKRIKRVIGWSIFPNFLDVAIHDFPNCFRKFIKFSIRHNLKGIVNFSINRAMQKEQTTDWVIQHGMYAYEAETPFDYIKKLNDFQMIDIAHQITQDILVLGASEDHFIAPELYQTELDALTNVQSLTFRLFTSKESASNHCNVGNSKLCFDTMIHWIEQIKKDQSC